MGVCVYRNRSSDSVRLAALIRQTAVAQVSLHGGAAQVSVVNADNNSNNNLTDNWPHECVNTLFVHIVVGCSALIAYLWLLLLLMLLLLDRYAGCARNELANLCTEKRKRLTGWLTSRSASRFGASLVCTLLLYARPTCWLSLINCWLNGTPRADARACGPLRLVA